MINVSYIKSLFFIHQSLKVPITASIHCSLFKYKIDTEIKDGVLEIFYNDYKIWRESLVAEPNFFGVETCSEIARIVSMIDAGDMQWKSRCRFEV